MMSEHHHRELVTRVARALADDDIRCHELGVVYVSDEWFDSAATAALNASGIAELLEQLAYLISCAPADCEMTKNAREVFAKHGSPTSKNVPHDRTEPQSDKPRGPTFLQDPRIHAMDGECVCGAKSCPQCGPSQICIQIGDNPENRSSNVKNVPRDAATAIIVHECRCEKFEAEIAWSRILALAAGTKQEAENGVETRLENGGNPPTQLNVKV
jgi:hypothetical protein